MKSLHIYIIGLLLSYCFTLQAQTDTLRVPTVNRFQRYLDKTTSSKAYQMTFIGVPLIAGGLIIKSEDSKFRSLRNEYLPTFRYHYDDYLQYLPAVAMVGMKIGGVKGRSSWGRMLVSDAFAVAIMAGTVNALKAGTQVKRPDGSNNHSFPSGHTATAFMTATMMHKEYGGRSPWYSIGAYSVATATGITRQMNNKHWLSDVLVGAGIGILSTELGYFLADLIFKEKGITHYPIHETFSKAYRPSFVGLYLGLNIMPGSSRLSNGSSLSLSTGTNAGLEGAYFFSPFWGIGARASATNMPASVDGKPESESVEFFTSVAGPYFSYPMSSRWLAGSKALVGYTYYSKSQLSKIQIGNTGGLTLGTGLSLTYLAKQNLGVRFCLDYNLLPSMDARVNQMEHLLTAGGAVNIMF